ncbi:MAG TPA: glycosyltransferase family 2 protein [candidate division Zixibacteria bacterium]|nr:glycosyltransferase family 2 protein [candidate division Zixibacteria bacterium]
MSEEKTQLEAPVCAEGISTEGVSPPSVSVVIPVRNEEKYLARCLDSVARQTYPHELIEILIVDGCSSDATMEIARSFAERSDIELRILDNPKGNTPCGLNTGYKNARGDVFIHFIGHAMMSDNFIEKEIEFLEKTGADAVGGLIISTCNDERTVPQGIGYALNSVFGLGGVTARTGNKPQYIDNPSFAAYRRELFDKFGYIDERLTRNQDYEFNQRITAGGARIYFSPEIKSLYFNRPTYASLWKEYFKAAKWRTFMIGRFVNAVRKRHLVPPLFVLAVVALGIASFFSAPALYALLALAGIYSVAAIGSALKIAFKHGFRYIPAALLSFLVIHFGYGLGFMWGVIYFWIFRKARKIRIAEAQ